MMLKRLWSFCRKPEYLPYRKLPLLLRLKIVASLVFWNLIIGIGIVLLVEGLFQWLEIDMGKHKTEDMFLKYTYLQVFAMMVLLAPLIEEFIFRGPLIFFKRSSFFPIAFYLSCLLFGLVHLSNFEEGASLLWWAPLLVAPQALMGVFLGFLRVKLGLRYAILMHMSHNGILFLLISLIELVE
ncbi:MAG: CPBP family intramembrane metalloprotease [Muriicola sp.]|nr:CPBP family intramembrane metalloprotease [Muriicola sp.]NNK12181.1 CPBP family intramembrane metalloprotease [Flavobacteriaceae bacterium]